MMNRGSSSVLIPITANSLQPNDKQWDRLIDHVAADPDIMANYVDAPNGHQELKDRWDRIANALNPLGPGKKSGEKWKECWEGARGRAKRAYVQKLDYMRGTGGGPPPELKNMGLSAIYVRILSLVNPLTISGNEDVPNPLQMQLQARRAPAASQAMGGPVVTAQLPQPQPGGSRELYGGQVQPQQQHQFHVPNAAPPAAGPHTAPPTHGLPQGQPSHPSLPWGQLQPAGAGPVPVAPQGLLMPPAQLQQQVNQWQPPVSVGGGQHAPHQGHAPQAVHHPHQGGLFWPYQAPPGQHTSPAVFGVQEVQTSQRNPVQLAAATPQHAKGLSGMKHTPPYSPSPASRKKLFGKGSLEAVTGAVGGLGIHGNTPTSADMENLTEHIQLLNATLASFIDSMEGVKEAVSGQTEAATNLISTVGDLSNVLQSVNFEAHKTATVNLISSVDNLSTILHSQDCKAQVTASEKLSSSVDVLSTEFESMNFGALADCVEKFNESIRVLSRLSEQDP